MAVILSRKPGGSGGGGGAPSGPAGGDLAGTYPNPTIAAGLLLFDAYAYVREEQAANTQGGTFTSGAWRTRTLNTEVVDTASFVSLAANRFTLGAGSYWIVARAPANAVNRVQAKIQNITDNTVALVGVSRALNFTHVVSGVCTVNGVITIAGSKAFELQQQCEQTVNTDGFGTAANYGLNEIYSEVEIWRYAA